MAAGGAAWYKFKDMADLVIVGICDGGTAASQGAIDAATLASIGVPTILLCTDAFVGLAEISLPRESRWRSSDGHTPSSFLTYIRANRGAL